MKKSLLCFTLFCYTAKLFSGDMHSLIFEMDKLKKEAIRLKTADDFCHEALVSENWSEQLPYVEQKANNCLRIGRFFALWNVSRGYHIPDGPMGTILQYQGGPTAWHLKRLYPRITHSLRTIEFWDKTVEQIEEHFNQAKREALRIDIPDTHK